MRREYIITVALETETKEEGLAFIKSKFKFATVEVKNSTRTDQQNKALWLWMSQIAEALNDKHFDLKLIMKDMEIPWSKDSVMEYIFRPLMKAKFGKISTKQLFVNGEIDELIDIIIKLIAEKTNGEVTTPMWPSIDNLKEKDYTNNIIN